MLDEVCQQTEFVGPQGHDPIAVAHLVSNEIEHQRAMAEPLGSEIRLMDRMAFPQLGGDDLRGERTVHIVVRTSP